MTLQFYDLDLLEEELKQLPHFHSVAFAASICERMLPMYNKFSQMENWGKPSLLRKSLNEIWLILHGKYIDSSKLYQLIKYLDSENVYPDDQTEYFCHFDYLFEAQFTVSALYSTLTALLTLDLKYIIGVVKNARFETIERFITERNNLIEADNSQDEKELIANHPLAKQELAKQNEDLQRLKEAETLYPELLEWLRNSSHNNGKNLIDLC
ncbi:MAG: DUF416 family protein [Microcoleaceae cyanobacterium]